ncbi:MAG TPA: ribosome maturation factor RimP [Candidatus Dormibacteraeota bacterium]
MAQQPDIEERVRELVETAVLGSDCELWDLKLVGTPPRQALKVFIDAPGGVDIERCMRVSRALRPALDEAGGGLERLDLEVSSPGAERPLRNLDDYRRYLGERVNVRFRQEGSETAVEGTLSAVEGDFVTVTGARDVQTRVPLAQVVAARLAVAFGGGDKIGRRER